MPKIIGWRLFQPPLAQAATWLIGGCFVLAALLHLVVRRDPVDAFLLGTLLMLSLWPYDEGERFVAPLLPVLVAYPLWLGLGLWRRAGRAGVIRVGLAVMLATVFMLHAAEIKLHQGRMAARREKAKTRLVEMEALAAWMEEQIPEGRPWLGITPNGHPAKVTLLGGAYLARRPITAVDVRVNESWKATSRDASIVVVHNSLVDRDNQGLRPVPAHPAFLTNIPTPAVP